jgi:serine/threonine protein kinase
LTNLPARYQPTGNSAQGGFGSVIFCTNLHLDRPVAIKFIQDPSEESRLVDEIRALLQMRSKHVVQVYDLVGLESGSVGIVEEYIDGEDLWSSNFPNLSLGNYLESLWQVASGLTDIHRAKIIHRDIKPNNMKLDGEGLIKIFDFGLARDEGIDAKTKGFKGTPGFAAPELYSHNTVAFSREIDTYAFGACAIFFTGAALPHCLMLMPPVALQPGYFSRLPLGIPLELGELLESCLSTDPAARPAMEDVRDEIARYLLKDKHQAIVIYNGNVQYLNSQTKSVQLELSGIGKIVIAYNGLHFKVK